MSNQLIAVENLPSTNVNDENFGKLAKSFSFLPSLKLYNASAGAVQEGKVGIGHFGLVKGKDEIIDLGKSVDIIPLAHRYKAVEKIGDKYLNYFKIDSDGFIRTRATAEKDRQSGCMAGIEFLFWLPEPATFANFYACNTSSLNAANDIKAAYGKAASIKSKLIKTPKFSWHGPYITACTLDLAIPDGDLLKSTLTTFGNPKDSEVEADTDAPESASSDR